MTPEQNKQLVLDYIDAVLVNRDYTQFSKFATDDFRIDTSSAGKPVLGESGLKEQMETLYKAFPDMKLRVDDIVADTDKVVVRFSGPGTHADTFAGVPPTGRTLTWYGLELYYIRDNKISGAYAIWDVMGIMQQLHG